MTDSQKPLVVYYSNCKSLIGEVAHKIALDVKGDIYEVVTTERQTHNNLLQDGFRKKSKIPIVHEHIDFKPYNEIFIGGEWCGKHLIGPMRTWIAENKNNILRDDVQFVFFGLDKKGSKINKTFNEMVELLGEPYRRLSIDPQEYPFSELSDKIGYHKTTKEELPIQKEQQTSHKQEEKIKRTV
ncbi:Flavodoxin-like domain-containing protein [Entamoeba marina]